MLFIKISGLRPSLGDSILLKKKMTDIFSIEQKKVNIIYSAGAPRRGKAFNDGCILVEIFLQKKKERTKNVLDNLCSEVRHFFSDMYSISGVEFIVIAIPQDDNEIGYSAIEY
ncbi:MAG: hypothetical protein HGB03_01345 [Candidatus Yonathbacteria bacterium]|nr:hypothetical protein [Candidatus Yonathbacteria bacterium]NTW47909.1 hypothetical protein [Candidatus Yonathbacteria bacterium]